MKKASREFNVFSMSALDLFASALGAFILLTIVLMPYFLRVDPDEVDKLRRALAEAEQQAQAQAQSGGGLAKFQLSSLDLVIALDTTGSMQEQIEGAKSEIVQLTQLLLKLSPSLAVSIIDYEDRCEGADAVRALPLRYVDDQALMDIVEFVGTMSAFDDICNPDWPEALAMALDTAIAMDWRQESKAQAIVIVTDAPAYVDRQAYALQLAQSFAASGPDSKISVVFRGDEDVVFLRHLAEAGNGEFVQAGASFTAAIVLALAS